MPRCAECTCFRPSPREVPAGVPAELGAPAAGGECRAHPPLVITMTGPGLDPRKPEMIRIGYWPPVAADDWCGEFSHRDHMLRTA